MRREQLDLYKRTGRLIPAAEYLRKSREEEGMSRAETLDKHRAALAEYAERYGYEITDVYEEVISGESLFARPQMMELLHSVSERKYEAVLCMDMQRLGRGGMYDQGFILDTFQYAETLIVTPERIYDLTNEQDQQAAEMETFMSRGEYRMITKRLRRGLMQSVENGAYVSNAPFGYRQITVGKLCTLEIVPEEAEFVRMIFRMYAEGDGCTRIADALTATGAHGRRGSSFNRNTVRLILENPVYIGKIRWNKTSRVRRGFGQDRKIETVYNDPEQWKILDGRHPPIIDADLWNAVQDRRKEKYFYVDNKHVASPLAGLVRCSVCGRLMNLQGKNKGVPYLLCPTKGCSAGAKYDFVEQAVLSELVRIANGLRLELESRAEPDTSRLEDAISKAQAHLKKLEDRRGRLYSLLEDGTYTRAVFNERMRILAEEESRAAEAEASLQLDLRRLKSRNKEKQLSQITTVLESYQSSPLPQKKELLHSVISVISYSKEKKSKPADFHLTVSLRDFD